MFELQWLNALWLIPLPWFIKWLFANANDKTQKTGKSISLPNFKTLIDQGLLNENKAIISLDAVLLWLFWLFLILSLSKPIWVDDKVKLPVKGRDIMLAIDLSGSMRENDFILNNRRVNRLVVVKEAAKQFVKARKNDRIGLIVFGDKAYLYSPLTFDKSLVLQFLEESQIGLAGQKTALYDSIILAIKHFRDNKKQDNEVRTLVLLTDGVNTSQNISLEKAVSLAKEENIKIYTIGLGADSRGFFRRQGVDEATLKYIAKQTDGLYYRAKQTQQLKNIYQVIDKLEQQKLEDKFYRPKKDLFFYPLTIALLFLSLLLLKKCRYSIFYRQ